MWRARSGALLPDDRGKAEFVYPLAVEFGRRPPKCANAMQTLIMKDLDKLRTTGASPHARHCSVSAQTPGR